MHSTTSRTMVVATFAAVVAIATPALARGIHMSGGGRGPGGIGMGAAHVNSGVVMNRSSGPGMNRSFAAAPSVNQNFSANHANQMAASRSSGNWHGHWNGDRDRDHRGGRGFGYGLAAGALLGGAYGYGYGPYYGYDDYGYDDYTYGYGGDYSDDAYAAAPEYAEVGPGYCAQRYKSYDPASGTYLGYDGVRHPCP